MFGRLLADPQLAPQLQRLLPHAGEDAPPHAGEDAPPHAGEDAPPHAGEDAPPHAGEDMLTLAADETRCFLNCHAQPLIVLYGMSVAAALEAAGIDAALVAGYSVGELTAHGVAGALAPPAVLQLAATRAACMDAAAPAHYGMLAVRGLAVTALAQRAAAAGVLIAIVNGPDHAVLAGPAGVLDALATGLGGCGAHVVPLRISVPAHSRWLAAGRAPLAAALARAPWRPHRLPVLSGVDGRPVSRADEAIELLSRQIAEPLDWARTLDVAVEMGARAFFEIGPGSSLARMARERFPEIPARALDDFATFAGAVDWLRRQGG
jgi:[acyl-carrier-protein] S-malonyltransferase